MQFSNSIGPKIGTLVAPPSRKINWAWPKGQRSGYSHNALHFSAVVPDFHEPMICKCVHVYYNDFIKKDINNMKIEQFARNCENAPFLKKNLDRGSQ